MLAFAVSMSVVGSSDKFESRLDAPTLGASCAGKWAPVWPTGCRPAVTFEYIAPTSTALTFPETHRRSAIVPRTSRLSDTLAAIFTLVSMFNDSSAAAKDVRPDKSLIQAHITFLADDLLEGRETGSRGYDIAARYVAGQFSQNRVVPKGDNATYYQSVPLRSTILAADPPIFEIRGNTATEKLHYLDDFTVNSSYKEDAGEITAPLVYAGYGIVAPRFGVDDYAGLDVKGKIVVLLSGYPQGMPNDEGAHFAGGEIKRRAAAERGAVGLISLQTPKSEKAFAFALVRQYSTISSMIWLEADGRPARDTPTLQQRAGLSMPASQKLLAHAGTKLEDLVAAADVKQQPARLGFGVSVHMAKKSVRADLSSTNVVGMVEGSDPVLKNEYVVFTAHLDHLGIAKGKPGDNIYNGAMDNASGVAVLIESARLLAQMPKKPRRSILFIALTGEEKGLLGADYFARNPTVPRGSIVANVNLDMPVLTFDFADVIAYGAEHSTLGPVVARAVKKLGIALTPDPTPEQLFFVRADHYMFVREGIPSLNLWTGIKSFNKNEDAKKIVDEFMLKTYHRVSDDLSLPFNYDAAARFALVNFNIGVEIANTKERPAWNKGNFFGDTFGPRKQAVPGFNK